MTGASRQILRFLTCACTSSSPFRTISCFASGLCAAMMLSKCGFIAVVVESREFRKFVFMLLQAQGICGGGCRSTDMIGFFTISIFIFMCAFSEQDLAGLNVMAGVWKFVEYCLAMRWM